MSEWDKLWQELAACLHCAFILYTNYMKLSQLIWQWYIGIKTLHIAPLRGEYLHKPQLLMELNSWCEGVDC